MNAHDFTDGLIERSTQGALQATQEQIGQTMAALDLSSDEWEALPASVQRRLIARITKEGSAAQ